MASAASAIAIATKGGCREYSWGAALIAMFNRALVAPVSKKKPPACAGGFCVTGYALLRYCNWQVPLPDWHETF
ncbi:hypothetical protein GCM10027188_01600 [Lysobacter humi (ex Lee et al. 2017)]